MAVADQPAGLMDIASSLTQDEIPFKLRCAICNKLAINAFRLPCCDQAICENCQASLPETCPVCAHTPISPDLCKPNKALRTTLKAFLRTEEKKREKERQLATPAISSNVAADTTPAPQETSAAPDTVIHKPLEETTTELNHATTNPLDGELATTVPGKDPSETVVEGTTENPQESLAETHAEQTEQAGDGPGPMAEQAVAVEGGGPAADEDAVQDPQSTEVTEQQEMEEGQGPAQVVPNAMGFNMGPGAFPNMAWNNGTSGDFNPMAQFMANGMFNFQNQMGMPGMTMDPMAANQGMFGGYGMNMNGMNSGMNMGMNFDASQGMYGGWDGSQNNMWNGGQDKFNPNAFANGMGPPYGSPSGFGGYNMSQPNGIHAQMQQQQFPSQDYQNGYYGAGYGRGNFRGRGRGFVPGGRGRGGFAGHMQANYPPNAPYTAFNASNPSEFNGDIPIQSQEVGLDGPSQDDPSAPHNREGDGENGSSDDLVNSAHEASTAAGVQEGEGDKAIEGAPAEGASTDEPPGDEEPQLRGIPTIDSLDQSNAYPMMSHGPMGMPGHMGFGRGYMRGPYPGGRGGGFGGAPFMAGSMQQEPRGQGVEGAPAAPRAMREGLPNTSVLRQRNFYGQGRSSATSLRPDQSQSATPAPPQEDTQPQSRSKSRSRSASRAGSTSRPRSRAPSAARSETDGRRSGRQRSPVADDAIGDPERRRDRPRRPRRDGKYDERPAEDDRRSRSPSRDSRRPSRRDKEQQARRDARRSHRSRRLRSRSRSRSPNHSPNRNGDAHDVDRLPGIPEEPGSRSESRASASRKERSSRREEDRERDRDARRRDRDRDRDRERDRDRDRERDRERDRDRDRPRDRERERDRDRDRYREREKERDRDRDRDRDRRDRDRDRKRSRRERTDSPADSEYSSRHHSRRLKRHREDDIRSSGDRDRPRDKTPKLSEPEKDPHTLEREARNRERMLKEQQRREAMNTDSNSNSNSKSSRRRDSRQERTLTGGRRLSYKYEDAETDSARAARVEKEREANRWA